MKLCTVALVIFGLLYLAALALFAIGTFGLLGSPKGPLAGVFLVPLGLPWIRMLDGVSSKLRPWLAMVTPLVNLLILWLLCRLLRR
jgi:hypothetical protein